MVTAHTELRWTESGDRLVASEELRKAASGNLDAFELATVEALAQAKWGGVVTSIKRRTWDHVCTYIGVLVANATPDRDEDYTIAMARAMESAAAHVLAFAAAHGIGFVYSWEQEDYLPVPLQENQHAAIATG